MVCVNPTMSNGLKWQCAGERIIWYGMCASRWIDENKICLGRGPAHEWYDALSIHLRHSKNVRQWFSQSVLFAHPSRFAEYLLECPSSEVCFYSILHSLSQKVIFISDVQFFSIFFCVWIPNGRYSLSLSFPKVRNAFMKIIVFLAHFSLQDGPCTPSAIMGKHFSCWVDKISPIQCARILKYINDRFSDCRPAIIWPQCNPEWSSSRCCTQSFEEGSLWTWSPPYSVFPLVSHVCQLGNSRGINPKSFEIKPLLRWEIKLWNCRILSCHT